MGPCSTPATRVAPQGNQGLAGPDTLLLNTSARVLNVPTSNLALLLLGANKVHFTGLALAALCQLSPTPGTASPSPDSSRNHRPTADGSAPESCWAGVGTCSWDGKGRNMERGRCVGRKQTDCRGKTEGDCCRWGCRAGVPCWGPGPPRAFFFDLRTLRREAGLDLDRLSGADLWGGWRLGGLSWDPGESWAPHLSVPTQVAAAWVVGPSPPFPHGQ